MTAGDGVRGRREAVDLSRVLEAQRSLLRAPDSELLDELAKQVMELVGADSAVVSTMHDHGFTVRAVAGQHCSGADPGDQIPWGRTLSALAVGTGDGQLSRDLGHDERVDPPTCQDHRHASSISAPLLDRGEVVGAVSAFTRRPGAFTDDHLPVVSMCAEVAGTRLARALSEAHGEELREHLTVSEQRLALAQRVTGLAWWEYDARSDRHVWSPELFHLLGLEPGSFRPTAQDYVRFVHPEDKQPGVLFDESGEPIWEHRPGVVFRVLRPNGEARTVQAWTDVQRDAAGKLVRVFGTLLDVTDRERASAPGAPSNRPASADTTRPTPTAPVQSQTTDAGGASPSLQHVQVPCTPTPAAAGAPRAVPNPTNSPTRRLPRPQTRSPDDGTLTPSPPEARTTPTRLFEV